MTALERPAHFALPREQDAGDIGGARLGIDGEEAWLGRAQRGLVVQAEIVAEPADGAVVHHETSDPHMLKVRR